MVAMSEGIFVRIRRNVKPWSYACSENRPCLDNDKIYFSKHRKYTFQTEGFSAYFPQLYIKNKSQASWHVF